MPVIHINKGHNYRRDRRLSWKARGILAYLIDHEEDWEVTVQDLIDQSDEDGRIAVQSAMQELIKYHYAKLELVRNRQGRVQGKKYIVYSAPYDLTDKQVSRQTENLPVGTDKQVSRQTENLPVGKEKVYAVPEDHRQAGFMSDRKHDGQKTCSTTKDLKPKNREERESARARPTKYVPDSWALTDELRTWAQNEVPGVNIAYETTKFQDYEFRTAHTDWNKAWRSWMRRAWEQLPAHEQRVTNRPSQPFKVVL